ncbi:MAG: hypothetical protein QXO71_02640, partial [Candidatus Jordarchaeaceae archaeon]
MEKLKLASQNFHRTSDKRAAKLSVYIYNLSIANKLLEEGNLEGYVNSLDKIIRFAKDLDFDIASFQREKLRVQSLIHIKREECQEALDSLDTYLSDLKEVADGTLFFKRMLYMRSVLKYLTFNAFSENDIVEMSRSLVDIYERRLGTHLFQAFSVLHTLATLSLYSIFDMTVIRILRNRIQKILVGEEEQNI